MRLLVLAAVAFSATSSVAQAPAPESSFERPLPGSENVPVKDCDRADVHRARSGVLIREAPRAEKLGELPPGDLQLAVMRVVDGCQEPVMVGYKHGLTLQNERGDRRR